MVNESEPVVTRRDGAEDDPKIVWDDAHMQTSFANVCNVLGTREEIMILFGSNQAWQSGQKEVKVNLTNRVVMNPYAAKRLQVMLDMAIRQYEERFGTLKL
ncbi:MAG: DUF3467 domain-containing protein [Magnetococcales bacterium]|nr:DUF3467 domain-containing protein [Magnetococcales bacterium]